MVVQHIVQYGCKLEGSIREVQNFEATLFVDMELNKGPDHSGARLNSSGAFLGSQ